VEFKVFHSGSLLVLPTNIRQGWKSVQVANALAYYNMAISTAVKSFIVQAAGFSQIKTFWERCAITLWKDWVFALRANARWH
jgi:hypothetical protein